MSDEIGRIFDRVGLRCTEHRRAVYRALAGTPHHPTADEIYQQLSRQMSVATVYNTLECFCRVGVARKILATGDNGSARYDATLQPHLHVRCETTGRIIDVPEDLGEMVLQQLPTEQLTAIEEKLGFRIVDVQIELVGEFK